jgi:hypothetical protein
VRFAFSSTLLLVAAFAALPSCTSSGGGGGSGCKDYDPPSSFDAQNPKVSFKTDVMAVFKQSCAFSTCHGATTGSSNGVFLGADPAKVRASTVNVKASELPTMAFVLPGDPKNSYLMRKMDGSQCTLDAQCTGGSCQSSMPKGEQPLPVETRDVVRRWIAQGAQDN